MSFKPAAWVHTDSLDCCRTGRSCRTITPWRRSSCTVSANSPAPAYLARYAWVRRAS